MSPSLREYEASAIDWRRLNNFARRVASETPVRAKPITVNIDVERQRVHTEPRRWFRPARTTSKTEWGKEEVQIFGPCWVLDRRYAQFTLVTSRNPYSQRTETEELRVILTPEGELKVARWTEVQMLSTAGPRVINRLEGSVSVRPISDKDVLRFDFWPDYYSGPRGSTRNETVERDDMYGNRLRHHGKGVGISKVLKALL